MITTNGIPGFLLSLGFWSGIALGVDSAAHPFKDKPIALVTNDWCPQHCAEGELKGYVIDIVEASLQEEKLPFEIAFQPWLRALRDVELGRKDGLLTPTVPGFSQFIYHEEAVGFQEYCFYAPRHSPWTFKTNADLLGQRIAFLEESGLGSLETYMKENVSRIHVTRFASDKSYATRLFQFLSSNRTDLVIITSDVYEFSLKRKIIADEFRSAGCLGKEKMSVGLSKINEARSRQIAKALDSGIRKLRKSGQLKEILSKYGLTDWQSSD